MPSGATHDHLTVTVAIIVGTALIAHPVPSHESLNRAMLTSGAILASGLLASPDLDTASSIYDRWGLLKWLWWPYQTLLPHRSWLSHGWMIAPWLRFVYCLVIVSILVGVLHLVRYPAFSYHAWWQVMSSHPDRWWILGGWWVGSALHSFADWVSTSALKLGYRRR